jgi:dihydroflavonol-4-reductase
MILVTGGTGLLGSHLLFDLVKSGKKVRALRRRKGREAYVRKVFSYYSETPDELLSQIEWFDADLLDFGRMEDAFTDVDEVYHAGAVVSFYPSDHKAMLKVNIEGTANLINLSLEKGIAKFCYVSSVATLGRAENTGISDEETYWVPSKKNSVYSISKYGAEREVWRGMEEGLNAVIVNPSVIMGPGYWQDNSGLFRLVYEGLKYYTRGVNGYVDVRDLSKAMISLMDGCFFRERFVVSAANLSYQEFFTEVAKQMGKPGPTVNVPPAMTGIAWRVESVRSFLTGAKPEITREMAVTTSMEYRYSNEKLLKRLNFRFTPIEESIRDICKCYLSDINASRS